VGQAQLAAQAGDLGDQRPQRALLGGAGREQAIELGLTRDHGLAERDRLGAHPREQAAGLGLLLG